MRKIFLLAVFFFLFEAKNVLAAEPVNWYMAGANQGRTSWVAEEVRGDLKTDWYQPIEPYIPYKFQPVFHGQNALVATARGLYVFNLGANPAGQSRVAWVYPTELPLGNSPTVLDLNGKTIAFTPSYDHKIHAIDLATHTDADGYMPHEAGAGFETNPLVVSDSFTGGQALVIAGNRDGFVYAFNASTGALVWKFQTGGPISASAAYKDGIVYVASQDMFVYSLNVLTGSQKWKSAKLGGQGLFSFWPVIWTNNATGKTYVFVNSGANYRSEYWMAGSDPGGETDVFKKTGNSRLPRVSGISGDWASGTTVMDAGLILNYLADKPYHRSEYVLDASNGQEFTFTYNGKQAFVPFSYSGVTRGGSKFPGIVNGNDGVFYGQTAYVDFNGWISRGAPVGWKFGTQYLSEVGISSQTAASDEPTIFSSGGNVIYFAICCDRVAVGFDRRPGMGSWTYWGYNMANNNLAPGYQSMYFDGDSGLYNDLDGWQVYAGKNQSHNGIYGKHGMTQSPLVPYQGKLYALRGNSLLAFSTNGSGSKSPLPLATIVAGTSSVNSSKAMVKAKLEQEVSKIISTGVLRPGFAPQGFFDFNGLNFFNDDEKMGEIFDYFANPGETVATLLLAYPHLSQGLQAQVKTYLQNNYGPGKTFDFTKVVQVGYNQASREWADNPPDWLSFENSVGKPGRASMNPSISPICGGCSYWRNFPPFSFYAAWKYAQIVGNGDQNLAKSIFNSMSGKIENPPSDGYLVKKPYFINLYLAGYYGYLQLKQMAGLGGDAAVSNNYNHLLTLRTGNFLSTYKNTSYWFPGGSKSGSWLANLQQVLAPSRNYMFLTPEIGEYMNQNVSAGDLKAMADEYNYVAPYWFVSRFDDSYGEGTMTPIYLTSILLNKTYVQKQPFSEVVKYLDAPAFKTGDLIYIQNLAAVLSTSGDVAVTPIPTPDFNGDSNNDGRVDSLDLREILKNYLKPVTGFLDQFQDAKINAFDFGVVVKRLGI